MSTATTSDNTFFDVAGDRHAPTIVFVHGWVVTRKMWLSQMRGLADDYFAMAPDRPGHGALAAMPFTFANAVQMLADLIRKEVAGQALVAGLSLGQYLFGQPLLICRFISGGSVFTLLFLAALVCYRRDSHPWQTSDWVDRFGLARPTLPVLGWTLVGRVAIGRLSYGILVLGTQFVPG